MKWSVLGLGTDIAYIPRFVTLIQSKSPEHVSRVAQRVLHPQHELPKFSSLLDSSDHSGSKGPHKAAHYLAARWAIKEALYKSLDPIDQLSTRFNSWHTEKTLDAGFEQKLQQLATMSDPQDQDQDQINIQNALKNIDRFKKPRLVNERFMNRHPNQRFHLSLSHDEDYVTATVIREHINR